MNGKDAREVEQSDSTPVPDGGNQHMAGTGYSSRFASSKAELPDDERLWWCPNCGAVFQRDHRERSYKFCNNCDNRDAVLIECRPVGPGSEEVTG